MPIVEFGGETYRYPRMSAWEQAKALEVIQPVDTALRASRHADANAQMLRFAEVALQCARDLSEEQTAALLRATLGRAERRVAFEPEQWEAIWDCEGDDALDDALDGYEAVWLALWIARASLARFFTYAPVPFTPASRDAPSCQIVEMPGNLRWLMTPVTRGALRYESLHDGSVDLYDIALINDVLAVEAENQFRIQAAMNKD